MKSPQRYNLFALLTALVIFQGQLLGSWHEATHHGVLSTTEANTSECSSTDAQSTSVELDIDHSKCPVCVLNNGTPFDSQIFVGATFSISDNVLDVAPIFLSEQGTLSSSPRAPPSVA